MNLFTAIINLASGYGFDVESEDCPVRVTALEAGTAAEITVNDLGRSIVVTNDTVSLSALASLFHSVTQFQRSRRLLAAALDSAAPLPEWAE